MIVSDGFSLRKVEHAARLCVPYLFILLFLALNVVALPMLPVDFAKPQFVLMAVYYWSIYRPTLVPPFVCFLLGLIMDLLTGGSLGVMALVFVVTQWIVRDQRRFLMGQPYTTIWAVFALINCLSIFIQWSLHGLIHLNWVPLMPVASSVLVSVLLFPFITLLLIYIHRMLPVASRTYP